MPRYSKYRAVKTEIDGIKFDSKKEARRYKELKLLERGKAISCLELQPVFDLIPKQIHNGKTIRKVVYKADFKYFDNNKKIWIVEDVKGFKTDVYKLKKKMFLFKYGNEFKFLET
ncbi:MULTISPECIES: DUF1064 domain-containing protein [Anaerococcus]|uniref:DUF1064 domain-containing protein n=1 Tax=Anaerococcus TaxID=165779 RepID=UPI001DD84329|nr:MULTISPECIES: DUF1064 domain-containing protein [Anaerococcus]MBS5989581.1 DUF1064 domain-containing protein [Anaerococcus hydrogenalis]MDU4026556.1 DUF1064 domain-containing protein [Anaerococcus sp.]